MYAKKLKIMEKFMCFYFISFKTDELNECTNSLKRRKKTELNFVWRFPFIQFFVLLQFV
jgi:hypothetical protein